MGPHDEHELYGVVESLPAARRVAFATACSEWLFPCFQEYHNETQRGEVANIRTAIDAAWSVADDQDVEGTELERLALLAESLVPSDDDEWSYLSALAQNAAASAAYACRTARLKEPQEAVWAARQLPEAGGSWPKWVLRCKRMLITTISLDRWV